MPTALQPAQLPSLQAFGPTSVAQPESPRRSGHGDFDESLDHAITKTSTATSEPPARPEQSAFEPDAIDNVAAPDASKPDAEVSSGRDVDPPANSDDVASPPIVNPPAGESAYRPATTEPQLLTPDPLLPRPAGPALLDAQSLPNAPIPPASNASPQSHEAVLVQSAAGTPDPTILAAPAAGIAQVGHQTTIAPGTAPIDATVPAATASPPASTPATTPAVATAVTAEQASTTDSAARAVAPPPTQPIVAEVQGDSQTRRRAQGQSTNAPRVEASAPDAPVQPPALERATQVNEAIRTERATGHPATTETSSTTTQSAPQASSVSGPATHNAALPTAIATPILQDAQPGTVTAQPLAGREAAESSMDARLETKLETEKSMPRVIRGLRSMINQRGGTLTMRLEPVELGELRVQMSLSRSGVTASFFASGDEARMMLEKNMGTLRTALEQQGLTVQRLTVSGQQESAGSQLQDDDGTDNNSHTDAGQGESRGRQDESNDHALAFADFAFDSLFDFPNELDPAAELSAVEQHDDFNPGIQFA